MTLMNQVDIALSPTDRELADNGRHLAAPSIESMLQIAIERNVSPEAMEKLVALYERVADRRAEQAFNSAMDSFRSECPIITKNREAMPGDSRSYRYADLPQICFVVDPILHKFGLTYKFDTSIENDSITVVCTVRHVDGHKDHSSFTCKTTDGTKLMNSAQRSGSAMSYGKRYSLTAVLGICTDIDDDGRSAAPNPKPDHDQAAPRVAPRDQRTQTDAADDEPRVTAASLNVLLNQWLAKNPGKQMSDFAAWSKGKLGAVSQMTRLPDWTCDSYEFIRQHIAEAK